MTKLVEAIAKSLVDNPDGVIVTETEGEQGTVIHLRVAPEDMGRSSVSKEELLKLCVPLLRLRPQEIIKR